MPSRFSFAAVLALSAFVTAAHAAPTVTSISLRGLQAGGTTTITLQGSDLLTDPKLMAPFAITKQEVLPNATNQQVQIQVTLDASVSPGIYPLRLASGKGIS